MSAPPPLRLRGEGSRAEAFSAVVLVRTAEAQYHLGLRHSDEPHEPVLHLATHRMLRDEALGAVIHGRGRPLPAAVIALALDPLQDELLSILAERIAARYANRRDGLAYGFGDAVATFEQDSGHLSDPDAAFTCATFALAVLRSVGVHLVDTTRWRQPTAEDLRWQREIGALLVDWIERHVHGDLPRAKERLTHDLGARRYRPTDVAGAALYGPGTWPAGADEVEPRARELEAALPWSASPL